MQQKYYRHLSLRSLVSFAPGPTRKGTQTPHYCRERTNPAALVQQKYRHLSLRSLVSFAPRQERGLRLPTIAHDYT